MEKHFSAFNQEKALIASRGLLRDYEPTCRPPFHALVFSILKLIEKL